MFCFFCYFYYPLFIHINPGTSCNLQSSHSRRLVLWYILSHSHWLSSCRMWTAMYHYGLVWSSCRAESSLLIRSYPYVIPPYWNAQSPRLVRFGVPAWRTLAYPHWCWRFCSTHVVWWLLGWSNYYIK